VTDPVKAMRIGPLSDRGEPVEIMVDGDPVQAYSGETVAAALMAAGRWTTQIHMPPMHLAGSPNTGLVL
jgi:hypothetical protein